MRPTVSCAAFVSRDTPAYYFIFPTLLMVTSTTHTILFAQVWQSLPLLESMFSACLRLFSYSTLKWYKCLALFPSNIYDILFFTFRSLFH